MIHIEICEHILVCDCVSHELFGKIFIGKTEKLKTDLIKKKEIDNISLIWFKCKASSKT